MQNIQHQAVTLPFESMTNKELTTHCYQLLPFGLPERAQSELVKRLEELSATQ